MRANKQSSASGSWLRAGAEVYLFALVLAILPFTDQAAIDIKRLITVWAVLLLAIACLIAIVRKKLHPNPPNALGAILAVYLAYTGFTALYSSHRAFAFTHWLTFAVYAVLYLVAAQCFRDTNQIRRLIVVVCAAATFASIYGFFQYAGFDPFPWAERASMEYRQMPSTFGNPNYAGHALILALILLAGIAWNKCSRRYLLLGVPLALHFVMTGMRSGRVALAAAALMVIVAVLAFRYAKAHSRAVPLALTGTALIGVLGLALLLGAHRVHSGRFLPLDPSLLLRYNSYYGASRMILTHPVTGVGPGSYVIENPPFWTGYEQLWFATESKVNEHVHNDLLEEAVNSGLPAAGLLLAFLLSAICQCLAMAMTATDTARRSLAYSLAAFFTAFLVDGLFGFNLRVPVSGALLFVMAGVVEGLRVKSAQTQQRASIPLFASAAGVALLGAALGTGEFLAHYNMYYGKVFANHNEHNRALTHFNAACEWAPWEWEPPCAAGQSAHRTNQLDKSITALKQCLALNQNYMPALDALARTYADRAANGATQNAKGGGADAPSPESDLREAAANADRALTLCPDLADTLECRGRISSLQAVLAMRNAKAGNESAELWKQARNQLETAAKLGAHNRGRVQRMLAEACIALGDSNAAQAAFAQSIEAAPDKEVLQSFLSFAFKANRYPAYLDAINAAISRQQRREPKNPEMEAELYLALADAYHQAGGQNAIESDALRNALARTPNSYSLWERYARLQNYQLTPLRDVRDFILHTGDTTRRIPAAIDTLLKASPAAPQDLAEAVSQAGQACLAAAQHATTESLKQDFGWLATLLKAQIDAGAGLPAGKGQALRALGALYAALGQAQAAEQALTSARAALTGLDRVYCTVERATLLLQLDRFDDALAAAEMARQDAPNDPLVLLCLARSYAALGRIDQARGLYEMLRRNSGLEPEVRAQVEQELGKLP